MVSKEDVGTAGDSTERDVDEASAKIIPDADQSFSSDSGSLAGGPSHGKPQHAREGLD